MTQSDWRARWALMAVATAIACNEGAPAGQGEGALDAPAWKSGARLRARVADGGYGAAIFLGWHDAALGIDCDFMRAPTGELRCLPVNAADGIGGFAWNYQVEDSSQFFADASCSQPLRFDLIREVEPGTRAVRYAANTTCSSDLFVTATPFIAVESLVGRALYDGEERWVNGVLSTCVASFPLDGSRAEPEDPAHFVRGTEVVVGTDPGLRVHRIEGQDGSRQNVAFVDVNAGAACELLSDMYGGAPGACLPRGTRIFDSANIVSTSATCSPSFTRQGDGCGAHVAVVLRDNDSACTDPSRLELVALGEQESLSPPYFKSWDGVCSERELLQGLPHDSQKIGPTLALTMFPHATRARARSGRLELDLSVTPDGIELPLKPSLTSNSRAFAGPFWDSRLETQCWAATHGDRVRCFPSVSVPQCPAEEPRQIDVYEDGCGGLQPRFWVCSVDRAPPLEPVLEVYRIGDPQPCVGASCPDGASAVATLTPVSPDELAPIDLRTE